MNQLIIHTKSRLILSVTLEEKPTIPEFCSLVEVPDDYKIFPDKKLDLDNLTQLDATKEDHETFADDVDPKRTKLRELNTLMDEISSDQTVSPKLQDFVLKLKEYLN